MTLKKTITLFLGFSFIGNAIFAQEKKEESEIMSVPIIGVYGGVVFPAGNMHDLYSPFMSFGVSPMYKTNKNWIWGLDGNVFFGSDNVRADALKEILKDLYTSNYQIIGLSGTDAGTVAYNRGFMISAKSGKLFPVTKKNLNSGIIFTLGAGYYQNQIIFQNTLEKAPQIEGDYAKGYDRQARGFQMSQYIGYMFMSNNHRFFNFHVGFEITQAWSKSTRDYIFDLHGPDNSTHFDLMYSIKGTWMFPLKARTTKEYYYY